MSTRKRARESLPEDHEEDELSPTKNTPRGTVLGSVKKRKLNTYGSSKSLMPDDKGIFGRLGGLFRFGSGKEKENVQSEEVDELSGDMNSGKEVEDIWEVPEENKAPISRRTSVRGKATIPDAETSLNKDGIWDVEVSDPADGDDYSSTVRTRRGPKTTPKSLTKSRGVGDDTDMTPKRSVGRPRREAEAGIDTTSKHTSGKKSNISDGNMSAPKATLGRPRKSDILKKEKALSREARRKELGQVHNEGKEEELGAPKRRRSGRAGKSGTDDTITEDPERVPVSRVRGRPKRDLEDNTGSTKCVPKGILTPSKDRGVRPRKSVVFEAADIVDLGFKDIPDSASTKQPKQRGRKPKEKVVEGTADTVENSTKSKKSSKKVDSTPPEEVDSDDSDDVACGICNGLDSEEPNEILFCDNCDNAFHQICYDVLVVPEGDWLCNDCRPDVDDLLELDGDLALTDTPDDIPDIEGFEDHLRNMQRLLLDKLTGQRPIRLTGHEEEMQKVHQVVEQTVLAGEGNSMLVIGSRGCGKTNLVESVISDLSTEHRQNFHVVRLTGFIHTDDKVALKEIWRQLGREMEVDDDMTVKSNHADTLASLLALLSHPSEISENQDSQTAKSVIFVLDEFDLFTTHPRQTLLYNLFDIAQARKAPIVVLGLTTRVDVVEALEKRVKSRFSHRYVHLSLPRSLPAYWEICKAGLTSDMEEFASAGFDIDIDGLDEFLSYWQSMMNDLYNKDAAFKHHLQSHFYRTKSVPGFLTSCILPIASLSPKSLPVVGRAFTSNTMSLSAPDSKLHILQGLSDLELALLIAAARLDIILDTDTCNFAMAYDEYTSLTSRHKIQTSSTGMAALGASAKVWGRDVALGAWERLAGYGLLVPAGIGGGAARDFGAGGRMWKVDVGLEEITGSVDGLSGVMSKWCREI